MDREPTGEGEDVQIKKDSPTQKHRVRRSLRKWSGLSFFEDYVLFNSTATKNLIFKALKLNLFGEGIRNKSVGNPDVAKRLKRRLRNAILEGGAHGIQLPIAIHYINVAIDQLWTFPELLKILGYFLINLYLTIIQLETIGRIQDVLEKREKNSVKTVLDPAKGVGAIEALAKIAKTVIDEADRSPPEK